MIVLEGTPVSAGLAMGTAVVVGVDGRPILSEQISREAMDALKRDIPEFEWQQIILACYEASSVTGITIPGLRIVGILAQSPTPPQTPPDVPCLVGIEGLLKEVENPVVVMIDAPRGVAYVDPDVQTVIAFQSPARHRPRDKRLFLDPSHVPATTLDGRTVEVWGYAINIEEVMRSVELGADGVFFAEEMETEEVVETVFQHLHGLPLMLQNLPDREQLAAAIRCSRPGQMRFAVKTERCEEQSDKFARAYSAAEEDLELNEDEIDQPIFVLVATSPDTITAETALSGVNVFIFEGAVGTMAGDFALAVHQLGAAAFVFGQETGEMDAQMIESGVDGIIVAAEFVAITKSMIATLPRGLLRLRENMDSTAD